MRDHMMGFAPAAEAAADVHDEGEHFYPNAFFDDRYPLGYPTRLAEDYKKRQNKRHAEFAKFTRFEVGNHAPSVEVLQRHCDEENKRAAKARELLERERQAVINEHVQLTLSQSRAHRIMVDAIANSSPIQVREPAPLTAAQLAKLDAFDPPADPAPKRWDLLHAAAHPKLSGYPYRDPGKSQVAALLKAPEHFAVEREACGMGFRVVSDEAQQAHAQAVVNAMLTGDGAALFQHAPRSVGYTVHDGHPFEIGAD